MLLVHTWIHSQTKPSIILLPEPPHGIDKESVEMFLEAQGVDTNAVTVYNGGKGIMIELANSSGTAVVVC